MKILELELMTFCAAMFVLTSGCAAEIDPVDGPTTPGAADTHETRPQGAIEERSHRPAEMPAEMASPVPEAPAPSDATVHDVPRDLVPDPNPCPSGVEVRR